MKKATILQGDGEEQENVYGTQWGSLTAAATVTVAPILLATMILRRRLVEGMTFGPVK